MTTRRKFIRTGVSALGIAGLAGTAHAHEQSPLPPQPSLPAEKLTGWRQVGAPSTPEGEVTTNAIIYSKQDSVDEMRSHTNIDRPTVTFFSATLRYFGSDGSHDIDGASVSLPLPFGFGVNLPVSLVRSILGFAAVPIPESVEIRARNAFASRLEQKQQFDSLETTFGDFPDSETYHKAGYQTLTDEYEGKWVNTEDDGVGEDVDFEGVLSVETTGDGTDFLAVGGMYPAEDSVVAASTNWPEFDPEAIRTELKELMRSTKLPAEASGGA